MWPGAPAVCEALQVVQTCFRIEDHRPCWTGIPEMQAEALSVEPQSEGDENHVLFNSLLI